MTSYYKYLPPKRLRPSWRSKHVGRYIFALLILFIVTFFSLYEFYATVVERAKKGEDETSLMEAVLCQVFMLAVCPKIIKDTKKVDLALDSEKSSSALLESYSITDLRRKIGEINKLEFERQFSNVIDSTIIIAVQVHNRIGYLEELIKSMSVVKDINLAILIFSHDYYDERINKLIKSIKFAQVMQIFYPHSIQLYPDEFPGTSYNDCKWDLDVEKAKKQKCEGADTPDAYGHFRQGEITQAKHHWWWKANTIFDKLSVTKGFNGYVMFLEEDHYIAPDILHTLHLMADIVLVECPDCNNIILGNFHSSGHYDIDKVDVGEWNNLGYAFNRSHWLVLHECLSVFCTYDDYNWDWSYQFTAQECFRQKLKNLVVKSTRVFHVGNCGGMHHGQHGCDFYQALQEAKTQVDKMKEYLFPEKMLLESTEYSPRKINKGWGGWSDPRDIQLCLNMSNSSFINYITLTN